MVPQTAIRGDLRAIRQARNLFGSSTRDFPNGVALSDTSGRGVFFRDAVFGIEKVKAF